MHAIPVAMHAMRVAMHAMRVAMHAMLMPIRAIPVAMHAIPVAMHAMRVAIPLAIRAMRVVMRAMRVAMHAMQGLLVTFARVAASDRSDVSVALNNIMAENESVPTDWRARIKEQGKSAFEMAEMRRLGFWPPHEGLQEEVEIAEREVARLDREMAPLSKELVEVEAEIAKTADVQSALDEIRTKRIERVKAEREARRERQKIEATERAELWKNKRATEPQFLGHGVSQGLRYEGGDAAQRARLGLPDLQTPADIAASIGIEARELTWLCYHRGASSVDHYHRFQIPKKRGGMRNVSSPKTRLRVAQRWLLESVLKPLPIHDAATAFAPGASVVDNARRHAGKAVVIRIDLKDFFPSIGFRRVKRLFENFGYNEGVATMLALLATEAPRVELTLDEVKHHVAIGERVLPQGACTSPTITNLLCRRLDARLSGIAATLGFTYSRYADDLVFSSDDPKADVNKLIGLTRRVVADEKLVVNDEKTAVMRPNRRQVVTGLVVNAQDAQGPRVSRHDLRKFRAFLHRYEQLGAEKMSEQIGRDALSYARGMIAWIAMSDEARAAKFVGAHGWLAR